MWTTFHAPFRRTQPIVSLPRASIGFPFIVARMEQSRVTIAVFSDAHTRTSVKVATVADRPPPASSSWLSSLKEIEWEEPGRSWGLPPARGVELNHQPAVASFLEHGGPPALGLDMTVGRVGRQLVSKRGPGDRAPDLRFDREVAELEVRKITQLRPEMVVTVVHPSVIYSGPATSRANCRMIR